MHIVTTTYRFADGSCCLTTRETRNVVDVIATWLAEDGDLLVPPTWTWWIGFGWRASLGTLLWRFGNRMLGRAGGCSEIYSEQTDRSTLRRPVPLARGRVLVARRR